MWQSFEKSIRLSQIEQILPMLLRNALRTFVIEGVACQLPSSTASHSSITNFLSMRMIPVRKSSRKTVVLTFELPT